MTRARSKPGYGVNDSGRAEQDRGAMLPIAMVLIVVLGSVAIALAKYAATAIHATTVVLDRSKRLTAAEGAMRLTLDGLRTGNVTCSGVSSMVLPTTNGTSQTVTCTTSSGQTNPGFSAVFTGIGVANGTGLLDTTVARKFSGDVFFTTLPASFTAQVEVANGDVWYRAASCGGPKPTVNNLLISTPGKGYICTTSSWTALTSQPALPPVPTTLNPPGRTDLLAGCTVFFPGRYTTSPVFTGDTYFVSGDYYFDNVGPITLGDVSVVGGIAGASPAAAKPSSAPPGKCANPLSNGTIAAASTGTGVTWVMGGNSSIVSISSGSLELYARTQGTRAIGIIALTTASSGYAASNLTATGTPLFDLQSGNGNFIFHGQVWAPQAAGSLGSGSGGSNWQFLGGLVLASLSIQEDNNSSRIGVGVTTPAINMLIQVAVNNSTTIRVVADVRPWTKDLAINSWRVV